MYKSHNSSPCSQHRLRCRVCILIRSSPRALEHHNLEPGAHISPTLGVSHLLIPPLSLSHNLEPGAHILSPPGHDRASSRHLHHSLRVTLGLRRLVRRCMCVVLPCRPNTRGRSGIRPPTGAAGGVVCAVRAAGAWAATGRSRRRRRRCGCGRGLAHITMRAHVWLDRALAMLQHLDRTPQLHLARMHVPPCLLSARLPRVPRLVPAHLRFRCQLLVFGCEVCRQPRAPCMRVED